MDKEIIHFAHANGFPSGTYNRLLRLLEPQYKIVAIEKLGHNPRYPVDDNWASLTDELIEHIETESSGPVIGIGHSLGAILMFRAAYQRPALFKQIIMLDPPLIYGRYSLVLHLIKKLGLADRSGPAALSKKRRTEWTSRDEALAQLAQKPLFARLHPDCLADYVKYGLEETDSSARLSFDPRIEVEIYKTTPHDMQRFKPSTVPGALVVGEHSEFRRFVEGFARKHSLHFECFAGGSHLFPLEHPDETATLVAGLINDLRNREKAQVRK